MLYKFFFKKRHSNKTGAPLLTAFSEKFPPKPTGKSTMKLCFSKEGEGTHF